MTLVIGTLNGQPLNTKLPDDSLLVGSGRPVTRTPEFAVFEGKYLVPILKVMKPAVLMPGDTLVAVPETAVNAEAAVGVVCLVCSPHKKLLMKGWIMASPPVIPNIFVQCPNCQTYHWFESPMMRNWAVENGLNLGVGFEELR